jgi:hypothetical protein
MVLTPAIRGLLGIEADVPAHRLRAAPQLPAEWSTMSVRNLPFGETTLKVELHRQDTHLDVEAVSQKPIKVCLQNTKDFFMSTPCDEVESTRHHLLIPLRPVELSLVQHPAEPGLEVTQWKVIQQLETSHSLTLTLEARGGSSQRFYLRTNGHPRNLKINGAQRDGDTLTVTAQGGYAEQGVEITWEP